MQHVAIKVIGAFLSKLRAKSTERNFQSGPIARSVEIYRGSYTPFHSCRRHYLGREAKLPEIAKISIGSD